MTDAARPLPYNQLSRWSGEMYIAGAQANARHLTANHNHSVILSLLARLCAPDWTTGGSIAAPATPTRFGSINAIARSLDRPFETVRRQVHGLARDGLVTIDPRGVALSTQPPAAATLAAFLARGHDHLVRLIEEYHALGVLPAPRPVQPRTLLSAIVTTAFDVSLLPFETWTPMLGDWTSMVLWAAIANANVRHVLLDPALSATYATALVPDRLRVPVTLAAAARMMGMSYATAWRHVLALEQRGLVQRSGRAWMVGQDQFRLNAIGERNVTVTHYILRLMGELVAAGLDPAACADLYLAGRPPLATLA